MNLIDKKIDVCSVSLFRSFQYSLIEDIFKIGLNYLIKHGLKTSIEPIIENIPNASYDSYKQTRANYWKIQIHQKKEKKFMSLIVPELVFDNFFIIYGSKYIPSLYITDEPIVIKEQSVGLYSLFCPVTMYFKNRRVILLGNNIPLRRFFQLLFDDKQTQEYLDMLDIQNSKLEDRSQVIDYFASMFNIKKCPNEIIKKLNSLIFDEFTYELYHKFYGIIPNFENVIKLTIDSYLNKNNEDFINLQKKRLVFMEILFKPYFKSISSAVKSLINNKHVDFLNINDDEIIKKFIKPLGMTYQFNIVNGYSTLITHKASYKNPYGKKILPLCVASIHPTYKNRICPTTISNTDPGVTVSLVPNQNIDFKFGIFSNN